MKLQLNNRTGLSVALLTGWSSLSVVVHARLQGAVFAPDIDDPDPEPRALQQHAITNIITVDTWNECVDMTPAECESHILETMNGDLSNHAIPNLNIVVSPARTPVAIEKSYWEVGIPTTVTGEVDCNLNNGEIRFPRDWETLEGTYTLQPVNCAGLQATPCCEKVIADMEQKAIPLVDVKGNCFSCRTHQEPLEPHIDFGTGNGCFIEHTFYGGECTAEKLTPAKVQAEDALAAAALVGVRGDIDAVLHADTVLCSDMISLHHSLLTYARSLPHVMSKAVGMLCGACDMLHGGADAVLEGGLSAQARSDLQLMHNELAAAVIRSDTSDIILYTDASRSKVLTPPVLGGSRTGIAVTYIASCVAPAVSNDNGGCDCTSVPGMQSDGFNGCQCVEEGYHFMLEDGASPDVQGCSKCPADEFWDDFAQTCYVCTAPSQVMILDNGLPICECPAAALEDLQVYWEGTWKNTGVNTNCMCPLGHSLVELDHTCYCPGGYKLWNVETESCQCPHGLKEDGASCICPGPHAGLDWNNVGWLDNGRGSCKVDFGCSLSPKDYYSDFEEGCSTCKHGYVVDPADGHCVLNCDRSKGLLYSRHFDECICENNAFKLSVWEQTCTCDTMGMEYNEAKEECECPVGFVREHTYSGYEIVYMCSPEDTGGDGSYYNYGNYMD